MFENQHNKIKEKLKMGEFEGELIKEEKNKKENNNNNNEDDEDGFEELRDFQLILMPAARQSAARRFTSNSNNNNNNKNNNKIIINEYQQKTTKNNCENAEKIGPPFVQRRQKNINNNILKRPPETTTTIKTTNKFPLIDEDLLMLISRNNNLNNLNKTTSPSLCRLITNVSECKWTTTTIPTILIEDNNQINIEEKNKNKMTILQNNNSFSSSWHSSPLLINQNINNNNAKNLIKKESNKTTISSSFIIPSEETENNLPFNEEKKKKEELIDDSKTTNCNCISAFSSFRRKQNNNGIRNNKKYKNNNNEEEEDIYQKSSNNNKNIDSGISSSPCSSSDNSSGTIIEDNNKNNLIILPPPSPKHLLFEEEKNKSLQIKEGNVTILLSKRRQTLNYLIGNIVRFLLLSPPKRTKNNKIKKKKKKKDDEKREQLFESIQSSPSTSPRNSTDKTETYDINKQSPRWRTDSINEALPAFNNNKKEKLPLIGELKQKPSTLIENKTKLLPLTNNSSLPVDNVNNNKLENKSPLETPSSSTTITTTNNLLPSIKQNNEKEKINIKEEEEENKYLNGNSILNNKINNNENISSTFLPQTAIQISALQAQQLKNAKSPPPIEHKNDLLIQNNNSEIINQQSNNNLEKQFSSSLSPPPCYQQALRLSPILAGRLAGIPKFHFPMGRPLSKAENDAKLNRIKDLFQSFPDGKISFADFDELCKRMDMAIYTKRAVYDACCRINGLTIFSPSTSTSIPENEQNLKNLLNLPNIDFNQFIIYWNRMCSEAHDEATQFIFTLNSASRSFNSHFLRKEDFLPILMDLILTHPGLHFLKEAPQFYSKYCEVVIVRIFWNVNRSWSGKITASELRRSNFLQTLKMLDTVTDINRITDYFSYEHFYVTYCKFWELDTDHDMVISRDDMKRHCNGALTDRIIDRIFSAAVLRTPTEQKTILGLGPVKQQPIETIGFEDFVCFLLAEEDKRHPTSVEYWFRCLDLDGDGQISLYEMEYFYEAIEQKLNSKNMETLALRDVICNLLDSISSSNGYSITRNDLKRSGLAHRFFNTFVNWIKYVDQESSDGERASVKTVGDKEISDWEVFCLTEYELLMSETEQISNEEEEEEEGIEDENIDLVLDEDDELEDSSFTTTLLNEEREQRLHGFLQHQQKQQNNHLIA